MTKFDFEIDDTVVKRDINRLTNQLWKLIPMRENEEKWTNQLTTVLIEIVGLREVFGLSDNEEYLILLSKLEGLKEIETEFIDYRKTVFESISLLRGIFNYV